MSSSPTRLPVTPVRRRVVFVVGAERSGTSVMAGALQQLGMHVPQPEVQQFSEPQWVADFHGELLERSNIGVTDARPTAWFDAAKVNSFGPLRVEAADWLDRQFSEESPELVIKEPRLGWFLGLWRSAAMRCGASPSYVTMLRPVTEVVGSRERNYTSGRSSTGFGEVTRTAAWVNMMLHIERGTRGSARAFVRYDDMLTDWTVPLFRVGTALDLQAVQEAGANDIRKVHAFVDPTMKRAKLTWDDLEVPHRLREIAEESWQALNKLADEGGDTPDVHELLDELRASYAELYEEADAIAQSSALAARREGELDGAERGGKARAERGPSTVRALVPEGAKRRIRKVLDRDR
jgi:hypothetical protein